MTSRFTVLPRESRHPLLILILLLSAGCRESVTVVDIPKERNYVIPSHWSPDTRAGAATHSFRIGGEAGEEGEVSILPMQQFAIGDAEIVNLWRSQMGMEMVDDQEAKTMASDIRIGHGEGRLYRLLRPGRDPEIGTGILTACLQDRHYTWFFRISGPAALVEAEEPAFRAFLGSVRLDRMRRELRERIRTASSEPAPTLPEWHPPPHWKRETPSSSIVLVSYHIDGAEGEHADLTITSLGGDGGDLLANINRWRGQIGLAPLDSPEPVTSPLGEGGTLVDMTGEEERILAAVVPVGGSTWFYKLMGHPALVGAETDAFKQFVESAVYPSDG